MTAILDQNLPDLDLEFESAPTFGQRLRSLGKRTVGLLRDPAFAIGTAVLAVLVLMALFAPLIAPYAPSNTDSGAALQSPSSLHLLGTDQLGRDIFSRIVYGARLSMLVSVSAVAISVVAGTILGLVSGYFRSWPDIAVMRAMDILLAFPGLILALVMAAVLGPGITSVIIAVGVGGVPTFARVTRGAVMAATAEDYVMAARSTGCRSIRIMLRHVLPNIAGSIMILGTLYLAFAVLTASTLSFLGVGVRPPTAEWGAMVNQGREVLTAGWWISLFPAAMIMLFVVAVNLVGDVLRDRLDATLRSRTANV